MPDIEHQEREYNLPALLKRLSNKDLNLIAKYIGGSNFPLLPIEMLRVLGCYNVLSRFPTRTGTDNTGVIKLYCLILEIHFKKIFGKALPHGLSPSHISDAYQFEIEKCLGVSPEQIHRQRAANILLGSSQYVANWIIALSQLESVVEWASQEGIFTSHPLVASMGKVENVIRLFKFLKCAHPLEHLLKKIYSLLGDTENNNLSVMLKTVVAIDTFFTIYDPQLNEAQAKAYGVGLRASKTQDALLLLIAQCGAWRLGMKILDQEYSNELTSRKRILLGQAQHIAISTGQAGLLHHIIRKISPWMCDYTTRLHLPLLPLPTTIPPIAILPVLSAIKKGRMNLIEACLNAFNRAVQASNLERSVEPATARSTSLTFKLIFIFTAILAGQNEVTLYLVDKDPGRLFNHLNALTSGYLEKLVPYLIVNKVFIDAFKQHLYRIGSERDCSSESNFLQMFQSTWESLSEEPSFLKEKMVKAIRTADNVDGLPTDSVSFLIDKGELCEALVADWMACAGCITGFNQVLPALTQEQQIESIMAAVKSNRWYFIVSVLTGLEEEILPEIVTRICSDSDIHVDPQLTRLLTALIDRLSGEVSFLLLALVEAIKLNRPVSILHAIFSGISNKCPEALSVVYINTVLELLGSKERQVQDVPSHQTTELTHFDEDELPVISTQTTPNLVRFNVQAQAVLNHTTTELRDFQRRVTCAWAERLSNYNKSKRKLNTKKTMHRTPIRNPG